MIISLLCVKPGGAEAIDVGDLDLKGAAAEVQVQAGDGVRGPGRVDVN